MIIGIIVIMGAFNKDGSFGKKHPGLALNWIMMKTNDYMNWIQRIR